MKFTEKLLSKNLLKNNTKEIGMRGEDYAVQLLKKRGYKILDRNYTSRFGEIDIIAKDKEYTCFVEVRLRKNNDHGYPADTINRQKQLRLVKTAQFYAMENNLFDSPLRFDAVLLNGEITGGTLKIISEELMKDAFSL